LSEGQQGPRRLTLNQTRRELKISYGD